MENPPLISIVTVTHNCEKWLPRFFESLVNQTYKNLELIFVDNASSDETISIIDNEFPGVSFIKLTNGKGFGVGCNIGAAISRGDYLFFLGTDTHFGSSLFEEMMDYALRNDLSLVGPKLLGYAGEDTLGSEFLSIDVFGGVGKSHKPFYIEGSAIMVNRSDFTLIGGFDDRYFLYGEDVDLSWRMMLRGMKIGVCESATVFHYGGGSTTDSTFYQNMLYKTPLWRRYEVEKNGIRTLIKNYSFLSLTMILPVALSLLLLEMMIYCLTFNFAAAKVIARALWWNVHNISSTVHLRKEIQRSRRIGDVKIFRNMTGIFPNKLVTLWKVGWPKFV